MLLTGFIEVAKVTKHGGQWDVRLTWYSLNATHWICRGREGDDTHWTVRYQAHLILSKCYSLNLSRSWRWRSTLDCETPNLPGTLWKLLPEFPVKLESEETHWTVNCWSLLIQPECYSLDLVRSWRWQTTLDCETPSSPDTLRVLHTGFIEIGKVRNHSGLVDVWLTWYPPSVTRQICFFWPWARPRNLQFCQDSWNPSWTSTTIWLHGDYLHIYLLQRNWLHNVITQFKNISYWIRQGRMFICVAFRWHMVWSNA